MAAFIVGPPEVPVFWIGQACEASVPPAPVVVSNLGSGVV
jgi:hypothetical protein